MAESLHEKFERYLREQGYRLTADREHLLGVIIFLNSNFTVDELSLRYTEQFRGKRVSLLTIFRTMNQLVEADILSEQPDLDGTRRFTLQYPDGHSHRRF